MDLKSTYSVFKYCLKWKEMFISLKSNNIRNFKKIIFLKIKIYSVWNSFYFKHDFNKNES